VVDWARRRPLQRRTLAFPVGRSGGAAGHGGQNARTGGGESPREGVRGQLGETLVGDERADEAGYGARRARLVSQGLREGGDVPVAQAEPRGVHCGEAR